MPINGHHPHPQGNTVSTPSYQTLPNLNRGPRLLITQLIYPAILVQDTSKANLMVNLVHTLGIGLSCALGAEDEIL